MTREDVLDRMRDGDLGGLLFHGTCEAFDLPPRPGGYDDVLWTADCPAVAQTYIPTAGIKLVGYAPSAYELAERVRPERHGFWYTIVRNMGHEALEIEVDAHGRLASWRLPPGYPTHAEAVAWLESQGYAFDDNVVQVSTRLDDGKEVVLPADWRMPGRLLVTLRDGLNLYDAAGQRDGDLTEPEYHDLDLFRRLETEGYDGVIINDFLQDERHGNVGHRSFGLFAAAAARRPWIEIPAVNRPWEHGASSTPDYESFADALRTPAPAP